MSSPPPWGMQSPSSSSPTTPMDPVGKASAGFTVPQCPGAGCPVPESWCTALGSRGRVPGVGFPLSRCPVSWCPVRGPAEAAPSPPFPVQRPATKLGPTRASRPCLS